MALMRLFEDQLPNALSHGASADADRSVHRGECGPAWHRGRCGAASELDEGNQQACFSATGSHVI
jgi:hypothetical protein